MVYRYNSLHIPSGKKFIQDFTRAKVEEGAHPCDPDLFEPTGVRNEVGLEAVNRWNKVGGTDWKYWI